MNREHLAARESMETGAEWPPAAESWSPRLWTGTAVAMILTACLGSYGMATWPMADDEVPSLVELGVLQGAETYFSVPADQIEKLPKATPVWNGVQRAALAVLPASETSYRVSGVVFGILTSGLAFLFAARWRGHWFAAALTLVLHGSLPFIHLLQLNRFYSLALLLLTLSLAATWAPRGGPVLLAAIAGLAGLTVLSHNLTVAAFAVAFVAAGAAYVLGRVPWSLVLRSGVAATTGVLIYFLYLRPLVQGWHSTGNPTPVLLSFAAHAGTPSLALALVGSWLSLDRRNHPSMIWWTLMLAGSFCLFQVTTLTWNPRYFLFFLPAVWMLAAHGIEFIARSLPSRAIAVMWYVAVAVLLFPGLLSHYQDGSRHDYRQAVAVVERYARPGQPILSDDAETVSYYLPAELRRGLEVRTRVRTFPSEEFFLIVRSNAWMPLPQVPGRRMDVLAEIYRRRYDHFSHIVRVYRVAAADLSPRG
jgi:hypothetical protein